MQKAVIIMGPPGAGKGTQANFAAKEYDLYHYDTGGRLRELIAEDKIPSESYDAGELINSNWILQLVKGDLRPLIEQTGVVLSGSPRTILEAFGDDENDGIIDFLIKSYGRENLAILVLTITEEESIKRDLKRTDYRSDDKPEIIRKRYKKQYLNQVKHTINEISNRGFQIFELNGMNDRETVFKSVKRILDEQFS